MAGPLLGCPTCGSAVMLTLNASAPGVSSCMRCGGHFMPVAQVQQWMKTLQATVEESTVAWNAAPLGPMRCASCNGATRVVTLRQQVFSACTQCGSAWTGKPSVAPPAASAPNLLAPPKPVPPPAAARAGSAQPGSSSPRGATSTGARQVSGVTAAPATPGERIAEFATSPAGIGAALALVLLGGGGWWFTRPPPPKAVEQVDPDAHLRLGSNAYDHYEFGGRPLPWWREHLQRLRADTSPEGQRTYQVALARARAMGLDVATQDTGVQVHASRDLARNIYKRLGEP